MENVTYKLGLDPDVRSFLYWVAKLLRTPDILLCIQNSFWLSHDQLGFDLLDWFFSLTLWKKISVFAVLLHNFCNECFLDLKCRSSFLMWQFVYLRYFNHLLDFDWCQLFDRPWLLSLRCWISLEFFWFVFLEFLFSFSLIRSPELVLISIIWLRSFLVLLNV